MVPGTFWRPFFETFEYKLFHEELLKKSTKAPKYHFSKSTKKEKYQIISIETFSKIFFLFFNRPHPQLN